MPISPDASAYCRSRGGLYHSRVVVFSRLSQVEANKSMGKRKTAAKPVKKVKQTLDITFRCLFCNHEKSVICTIDKKNGIGDLHCKICGQSFQTAINSLSHPVDIYSDWIDACEDLAEDQEAAEATGENGDDAEEDEYSDDDAAPPTKIRAVYDDDDF